MSTTIGRQLMSSALLTAALALGALGAEATAGAEPREWDIGAYDACTKKADQDWMSDKISWPEYLELRRGCCSTSGGIVQPTGNGGFVCVAPPANAETQPTLPGEAPPPVVATQNPAPPPPPIRNTGVVTRTFAPDALQTESQLQ
jgi:hypothetical protein